MYKQTAILYYLNYFAYLKTQLAKCFNKLFAVEGECKKDNDSVRVVLKHFSSIGTFGNKTYFKWEKLRPVMNGTE